MRLKVTADGSPRGGTKVTNAETGESIYGVTAVAFSHDVKDSIPRVEVKLMAHYVSAVGKGDVRMIDPGTGQTKTIKRIEFEDGSEWVQPAATEDGLSLLPKSQWTIKQETPDSVTAGLWERNGYRSYEKIMLSDLPNDLIGLDVLERFGIDLLAASRNEASRLS